MAQIRIIDLRDELNRGPAFSASHSSLRPILVDTINYYPDIQLKQKHSRLYEAVIFKHLIYHADSNGVNFSVDPLINLHYGYDMENTGRDSLYFTNTRGVKLEGNLGKQFSFVTLFYENQSKFAPYIADYVRKTGSSIGMGRTKAFKVNGFDYAMATGMIVYRPMKYGEIWFGHGKNFIGNGYRSLLLSDNTATYPHLRLSYGFFGNRLRYQVIFAQLNTGKRYSASVAEPPFITKGATFNYLTYSQSQRFEIGLFEGTMWRRFENGREKAPDAMRYNPMIGLNSITQGLSGANNSVIGLNMVYRPMIYWQFYAQIMSDGPGKSGVQIGVSKANLFTRNLFVRLEGNIVSRGSYAQQDSLNNYTNFQQALAHPMGAGFKEVATTIGYRYRRWIMNFQSSIAAFSTGYLGHGRDLTLPDEPLEKSLILVAPKPSQSMYLYVNPSVGFIVNPSRNLQFNVGGIYRKVTNAGANAETSYIFVGLSTNLNNLYFDL